MACKFPVTGIPSPSWVAGHPLTGLHSGYTFEYVAVAPYVYNGGPALKVFSKYASDYDHYIGIMDQSSLTTWHVQSALK